MTDFDQRHDVAKTSSEKWNPHVLQRNFGTSDVLPFWVADMDFEAPAAVRESLTQRTKQGVFSYEVCPDGMFAAATAWHARRHNWNFDHDHLCFTPGALTAISILLTLLTNEGDGVIVQPPVYFQFQAAIESNNRTVVTNPLTLNGVRYEMDFDNLHAKAANPQTKVLLLCSPHNPVGRVWKKSELQTVAEICLRHNVTVIADEVHGDFVFEGQTFIPFCSLSPEVAEHSISCFSAAKTFNIPAITNGFAVIGNDHHRAEFRRQLDRLFLNKINSFTAIATEAAYRLSEDWADQSVSYVHNNAQFLNELLQERVPQIKLIPSDATFLAWLDFRSLELQPEQLERFLIQEARLALKSGHSFGPQGEGFARMAIGCPKALLQKAVSQLETAINRLER